MPFAPNFCSNELDSLTSDGPTPKVHELDALLHKVEIDKAGILSEISILENTVSDYKRRVQKLEDVYARKIRFHRSALSRFPKEILTIIFEELCIENSFASEETIYAMTLCRVCKLWKQIVENHGQCWSTFHIRGSCYYRKMKDEKERAKLQRLTKIFLAHAVTGTETPLPLTMRIDCETIPASTMTLLLKETPRWRDITFRGTHEKFGDPEFAMNYLQSIPLLESLSVDCARTTPQTGPQLLLEQFEDFRTVPAGVLYSLRLFQYLSPAARSAFPHWQHLTTLELHHHSPDSILDTLQRCVSAGGALQSVTLVDMTVPQGGHVYYSSGPPVTLSTLRRLLIFIGSERNGLRSSEVPKDLLTKLTLPVLTMLKIHVNESEGGYENRWTSLEDVEQFFMRSKFPLEELSLFEVGVDDIQLKCLLQHVSATLKVLSIVEMTSGTPGSHPSNALQAASSVASIASVASISNSFALSPAITETLSTAFLLTLDSSRRFLPKLRELHLTRGSGLQFDRETFIAVVRSRSTTSLNLDRGNTMVPLMKVSLRIRIPEGFLPKERRGVPVADPSDCEVYRSFKTE